MRTRVTATAGLAVLLLALPTHGTAATAVTAAKPGPRATQAGTPDHEATRDEEAGPDARAEAEAVLAEATALFDGVAEGTPGRGATLVLLDLTERLDALDHLDRAAAKRLLARPTDPGSPFRATRYQPGAVVETTCSPRLCLHWVETTSDAVPPADADTDGVPDWTETSMAVAEEVLTGIVDTMGYRPPRDDSAAAVHGPNGLLDVYLTDVGDDRYYGYCVSEPVTGETRRSSPGYCVLDNDYAAAQYGGVPLENLQVTAAHELFHAVQFGYDAGEDDWLLEGGATWMEEQLYDDVDDNRQYLADSPVAYPLLPVDYAARDFYPYGSWSFLQLLTERLDGDRTFMREVWEDADDAVGGGRQYGLQALAGVLDRRGYPLPAAIAEYGAANLAPGRSYEEGRHFPTARPLRRFRLTAARPDPGARKVVVDHLANATLRYSPHRSLPRKARLRVVLDLPRRSRGSLAHLVVKRTGGRSTRLPVRLDRAGDGRRTIGFSPRKVRRVDLVLTNASARYRCHRGTLMSCQGIPRDDDLTFRLRVRAVRR